MLDQLSKIPARDKMESWFIEETNVLGNTRDFLESLDHVGYQHMA